MQFLLDECEVPYKPIYLGWGDALFAIVDNEDYDWVIEHVWSPKESNPRLSGRRKFYAYRTAKRLGWKHSLYLHKVICTRAHGRAPALKPVADHCNGQSLDCRRSNLRWASRRENSLNVDGAYARQLRMFDGS